MLSATMITFFSDMHASTAFLSVMVLGFKYRTVKVPIVSFIVIIRIVVVIIFVYL